MPRFGGISSLADKKKPGTASDETDRPDDDLDQQADTAPAEDTGESESDPSDARIDETIEDAEIVGEVPAIEPDSLTEDPPADPSGTEPQDTEADPAPDTAPVADEDPEDFDPSAPRDAIEIDDLDPDAVSRDDISDLEQLDGAELGESETGFEETDEDVTATTDGDAPDAVDPEDDTTLPSPDPVEEPAAAEPSQAAEVHTVEKETVVVEKKSGGVLPGFLGGLVAAAGLAFAAPYVVPANMLPSFPNEELEAQLAGQSETVAALEARLSGLESDAQERASAVASLQAALDTAAATLGDMQQTVATGADLDAVKQALEGSVSEAGDQIAAMSALADALGQRVNDLEKRPIAEARDPAAVSAVQAYGREVDGFRGQMEALRADVQAQMAQAQALVEDAASAARERIEAAEADAARQTAEAEARHAAAAAEALRAARVKALVDIQAALDAGEPYAGILEQLDGLEIPASLAAPAEDGVDSLSDLNAAYTRAAREALAAARKEAAGDDTGAKVTSFLQSQLGLRSLAPAEGEDPDAVLSRAEAAARQGDLEAAVSELSALPDSGQQAMADWMARATARAEALAAADELAASLAAN